MNDYKSRKIAFKELLDIEDWKIKVYTISKAERFDHPEFYESVKMQFPEWFSLENSFESRNEKVGFVILHAGTEGIFTVVNWWVGKNMLNTHIFLTEYNQTPNFQRISGDGLAPCFWEMEVINYERVSWANNVLKRPTEPRLGEYLTDTFDVVI